jgi:nucleotide-binding universal stress UspA family protein
MKILLAVDGSKPSLDAVDQLVKRAGWFSEKPALELLFVHFPLPQLPGIKSLGRAQVQQYYQDEGMARLAPAKKRLDAAGVRYNALVLVGEAAETIVKHAKSSGCELICVGPRGMSAVGKMLLGSTTTKVLQFSDLPVLLLK